MISAVVAVCIIGLQSGNSRCYDTQFESRHWIDCQDSGKPAELATAHRGSGLMRVGNVTGGRFVETHRWRYAGGGWYVISWPVVQVLLVVDENEISRGGFEGRLCNEFDSGSQPGASLNPKASWNKLDRSTSWILPSESQ